MFRHGNVFRRKISFGSAFLAVAAVSITASWAADVPPRKLAAGVLSIIPPEPKDEETFQGPLPLRVTQQVWDPPFTPKTATLAEIASQTTLRRNIWNLEFAFKPVRMVYIDIPQINGKMHRKLIWYMVYRVKNNGKHLTPVPQKDDFGHTTYTTGTVDEVLNYGATQPSGKIFFFPHFVLASHDERKEYLDRIIPVAIPVIQQREMRGGRLLNTVEISRVGVEVSTEVEDRSVWGVVTWDDVDPRTDFFSIYVQGLTNAFKLEATDQGVVSRIKTLQLNFWRPSDPINEHEEEIRYGVPAVADQAEQARILAFYNIPVRVDHLWLYR